MRQVEGVRGAACFYTPITPLPLFPLFPPSLLPKPSHPQGLRMFALLHQMRDAADGEIITEQRKQKKI